MFSTAIDSDMPMQLLERKPVHYLSQGKQKQKKIGGSWHHLSYNADNLKPGHFIGQSGDRCLLTWNAPTTLTLCFFIFSQRRVQSKRLTHHGIRNVWNKAFVFFSRSLVEN
jgi:hypothetical protein